MNFLNVEENKEEPKKPATKKASSTKTSTAKKTATKTSASKSVTTKTTAKKPTQKAEEEKKETVKTATKKTATTKAQTQEKKETPASVKSETAPKSTSKKTENKEQVLYKDKSRVYHISKNDDGKWQVKLANGEKAIKLFDTQLLAINYAKELVKTRGGSIRIHSLKGKIRK